ncbi:hypothetical protein QE152_g37551 [Popillia japonica]|uniref:Uncharacterized protein n=1 Tax=Popillia japonica TaxID=7064 RepID=A0AAW1IA59_POPJA
MPERRRRWDITFGLVLFVGASIIIAGVLIPVLVLITKESFYIKPASLPTSLYVYENEGYITLQWAETGLTDNGSYILQYSIDGGKQTKIYTKDVQHTVVKPSVCSNVFVQIQTVSETGDISKLSLDHHYTVLPLNAFVTNTSLTRTATGLIASWEKPIGLENCDVSYAVRFTSEFGQFNVETDSHRITVPNYIFCLFLRIEVSSIVGFSKTKFSEVGHVNGERIQVDLSIPPENPSILVATWRHHNENRCSPSYTVTYEFGLDSETFVVSKPRVIFDVRYCVFATLRILPSAFDGEYTGSSTIISATQYPTNMVLQPVENIEFIRDDMYIAVSWDVPEYLSRCSYLYTVTARNDYLYEGASCEGTGGCAVSLDSFCPTTEFVISPRVLRGRSEATMTRKQWKIAFGIVFSFGVFMFAGGAVALLVILLSSERYCSNPASLPTFLEAYDSDGIVRIHWSETGFTCNGSYILGYSIDAGAQTEILTGDRQYMIWDIPLCSDILIRLWTVSETGKISEEYVERNYTVLPLDAYVTNTEITKTDQGIVVSWQKPTGLKACKITYNVQYSSELGEFSNQTDYERIIVPSDIFCFTVRIYISTVVGFSKTSFGIVGSGYANIINEVNFNISSENPALMIAYWSHPNEKLCSMTYKITYILDAETQSFEVPTSQVTLPVQYCQYASFLIRPIALNGTSFGFTNSIIATQYPKPDFTLQPVQNVQFSVNGSSITVSWNPIPEIIRECDDLYTVHAKNTRTDEENSCQGTDGCRVILTDFCPTIDFSIRPRTLQGDAVFRTFTCD